VYEEERLMKSVTVGVSDCRFSEHPDTVLVTYALGSCIAVSIHDPALKIGGLLHYMLPESSLHGERADRNPFMFADSGIHSMLRALSLKGVNPRRSVVKLAGGASVMNCVDIFEIGKRNYLAAKKVLWKEGLLISAEAVGGAVSRTVRLDVETGKFFIREAGGSDVELTEARKGVANGTARSDRR
jgi:chemotaxis protein CheD